jgi:hypothetical protein
MIATLAVLPLLVVFNRPTRASADAIAVAD